jgi:ATP-binding cassette subfamily B (MDR/TAP) protein 1
VGSNNILRKLKRDSVEALVKQEIAFFDDDKSSAGALTSAVSTHPANVGAATGNVSAELLILGTFCLGSILLTFILEWKTAVVCLSPLPLVIFAVSHCLAWRL